MPVAAPNEGYIKMIEYGRKKASLRLDQLALQGFLAGFWVAIYGHCSTVFASLYWIPSEPLYKAWCRTAYSLMFPGAFMAVIYTGTELFTGNTVTMIMLLFHEGWKTLRGLGRVWALSLLGNFLGAVFGAFFFSYLSGVFDSGNGRDFLFYMAEYKTANKFLPNFILGVGCNALVCLATWCVVCSDDGSGKIVAIIYSVGVFAAAGFEHIIANFYTLTAAYFCGYRVHSAWEIIWRNWLPVLLGNLLAGTLFTGVMWWYALHPTHRHLNSYSDAALIGELGRRYASMMSPAEMLAGSGTCAEKTRNTSSLRIPDLGSFTHKRSSALSAYVSEAELTPVGNAENI